MTNILFSVATHEATLDAHLAHLDGLPVLEPFSAKPREFVAEFVARLRDWPSLRSHPELAALAHWFRPASLNRLAGEVEGISNGLFHARGRVFHIAPANVDVLFAYTWLLSVLCGNRNVVRLSQKPSAPRDFLVDVLWQMHQAGGFEDVLARTVLLTYGHDDSITREISAGCHARIIWGGDGTVSTIRAIPLAPLALELVFPDRFGVAVLGAQEVAAASDKVLLDLARRFCSDLLTFDQQACSSPRCLYWVGEGHVIAAAKAAFWPAVRKCAERFPDETAALLARVSDASVLAAMGKQVSLVDAVHAYPMRLAAERADGSVRETQSGHGLVVEVDLPDLDALRDQLDDRDQTCAYFGVDREALRAFVKGLGGRAVDRVVPVGRALEFHYIWDGVNLLHALTRRVTLS